MVLQSQLLRGDAKLEAAAVSDPAHIVRGASGSHVAKIQQALIRLDGAAIAQDSTYGPATAAAVRAFKTKRRILNFAGQIDEIVGKKTMAALDSEMLAKEGKGGGGSRGRLGFGVVDPLTRDRITHTLIYFGGVADRFGLGGLPIVRADQQEVFNDMLDLNVLPELRTVNGFGGSLINKQLGVGVASAITATRDPRGLLIIYGYSAGGINSLDLCRRLNLFGAKVDLLVTVDVSGQGEQVDRTVPPNVILNRNYFQTDTSILSTKAVGGRAIGGRSVINIDCNDRPFEIIPSISFNNLEVPNFKTKHGQMQDITRLDAIRDMRVRISQFNLQRN